MLKSLSGLGSLFSFYRECGAGSVLTLSCPFCWRKNHSSAHEKNPFPDSTHQLQLFCLIMLFRPFIVELVSNHHRAPIQVYVGMVKDQCCGTESGTADCSTGAAVFALTARSE